MALDHSGDHHASWLPRDVPYNEAFEDAAADLLLAPASSRKPPSAPPGDTPLPKLSLSDLPLALNDPRRRFPSSIPGLNLTHPGGYLEGGPGIDPSEDEFARHFVSEHRVHDAQGLAAAVAREVERHIGVARERARERRRARERNEQITADIKKAVDQMELETRVLNKAKERARERRERKEKRRSQK